jgi:hypothetical protein
MGTYDRQVALAERLIREKGKAVNIVRLVPAIGSNPWDDGPPTEVLDPAFGVFLNFNQKDLETQSLMPSISEIQASDRKVLIAAASTTSPPTLTDMLRDESGDWSIKYVQELSPNGENILYTLRASR